MTSKVGTVVYGNSLGVPLNILGSVITFGMVSNSESVCSIKYAGSVEILS